jgi:hypothetical protein
VREGTDPKSQKKEYNGVLFEMLISEVWKMSILFFHPLLFVVPPSGLLALPFYRLKGRIRLTTDPRRCLGGKGEVSIVCVAVATCPGACRPSLGRRGDVDDGTTGHPECCSGRAFSCGRRTGRGLLIHLMAVEAGSKRG